MNNKDTFRCTECGQDLIHTEINSNPFTDAYVCPKCGHKERFPTKLRKNIFWSIGGLYAAGIVLGSLKKSR